MAIPPLLRDTASPPLDAAGPIHKALLTPQCRRGNSRFWFDDTELAPLKYQRSDYEPFLRFDLRNSRVLVDIDKFSETVLRIPFPDARSHKFYTDARLNGLVDAIYGDALFKTYLQLFLAKCREFGRVEKSLYMLHAEMNSRAMKMIEAEYPGRGPNQFSRNDHKVLMGGILNRDNFPLNTSPETNLTKEQLKDMFKRAAYSSIYWATILLLVEGRDGDCTLWDGRDGFRILDPVTKKDPFHLSAPEPSPKRKAASQSRVAYPEAKTKSLESTAPKRRLGGIDTPSKRPRSDNFLPAIREEEEAEPIEPPVTRESVPDEMAKAHSQCARYGFEALSVPALRDSFVMHLFDRNRVQVLYYSHALMLNSTAIDLEKDEDVKRFIALLVGHHRLTMRERGILPVLDQAESFLRSYQFFSEQVRPGQDVADRRNTYCGITMALPIADGSRNIKVTLGSLIAEEPGIIVRSTSVFEGTCDEWPGMKLVVKLSWPGEKRTSEAVFLEAAKQAGPGKRHWVLDHLPSLHFTHDFATEEDSTEARIAQMLSGAEFAGDKTFSYENRVLRITIHELLYPLETLTSVQDVAQVFADVVQCHGWLYEYPKILHRDISLSNIVYRVKADGRICGVLNDFDLSSFLDQLAQSTAHPRTGTPPFMAMDLLVGDVPLHLYRHDLESFFYVMIVFMLHYELQVYHPEPPEKKMRCSSSPPPIACIQPCTLVDERSQLPFSRWFQPSIVDLVSVRNDKRGFFTAQDTRSVKGCVSPSFQALVPWLKEIHVMFLIGLVREDCHAVAMDAWESDQSTRRVYSGRPSFFGELDGRELKRPEAFDDGTLGGAVSYRKFMSGVESLSFEQDMVFNYFADLS